MTTEPSAAQARREAATAPECRRLVTRIFARGDENGWKDTVFGVKESLIKDFTRRSSSHPTPDRRSIDGP